MSDGFMLYLDDDGVARHYDDTYDITIHCESKEEQERAIALIKSRQWIPCSERLPEYDAPALLSTAWGKTEIGWWTQRGWVIVPASYRELKQDAVVAWMPLPKPYKGEP